MCWSVVFRKICHQQLLRSSLISETKQCQLQIQNVLLDMHTKAVFLKEWFNNFVTQCVLWKNLVLVQVYVCLPLFHYYLLPHDHHMMINTRHLQMASHCLWIHKNWNQCSSQHVGKSNHHGSHNFLIQYWNPSCLVCVLSSYP